jgi:two-component system, NtrC family, response regulator AtoC
MSYAVLVVEDEATLAKNVALFLQRHGHEVKIASSAEDALSELETFKPDAVVLDFNLPGMSGLELLHKIRASDPHTIVIMATGHGSEQVAVDAMKAGAHDYLMKPVSLGKLKIILDKALGEERKEGELSYYRQREASDSGLAKLVGGSTAMRALKDTIRQLIAAEAGLADRTLPAVLIVGETGTGKELVARALHFEGTRKRAPFVEVNCSSIPGQLLEAELFGYERGAFTDAKERKLGLIEAAEGGTLFLDEIGEMDLALQAKLLRFLENKIVRRLGSVRDQEANVRIVAATNRNLESLVRESKFRSDLYFRLRIIQLELPPLRTRNGDVVLLAEHFLKQQSARYGKPSLRFGDDAMQALLAHSWPGNVRELRNAVEQCVILARGEVIAAEQLRLSANIDPAVSDADLEVGVDRLANTLPEGMRLDEVERELLRKALEQTSWNVSQAARLLGVSRDTMRYRIEKHHLKLPS